MIPGFRREVDDN